MNSGFDIAVVGMAGRFPGAEDVDGLWRILCEGRSTISWFGGREEADGEIRRSTPVPGRFVPASGVLKDIDCFDAEFFQLHPREAEEMDPQHRIFLECAWHALEDAGYGGADKPVTGLYASCGPPAYLLSRFCQDPETIDDLVHRTGNATSILNGNERDLLPLRTAYKLDLKGPTVNVQSACSSSLVAVAHACQCLVNFEADMCLAGGVHLKSPEVKGYYHQRGGILSADGHCRPFDRESTGTVFGDGVGIVVLRRLEDALAAGDRIDAVIRGWALNNDGRGKASLSAPSAEGQRAVITAAHAMAGVTPDSVQYVEAHGTGTVVGDGIELAGLRKAWGETGGARCGVGSIKSNIGHLDVAAGIAGLIKTVLCLKHRRFVPSLRCDNPLPELTDPAVPFYIVQAAGAWPDGTLARAGVSSLGVGGTNCHIVLEEGARERQRADSSREHVLALSAPNDKALHTLACRFRDYLESADAPRFDDICYTSNVGRTHFDHRLAIVAPDAGQCRRQLLEVLKNWPKTRRHARRNPDDDARRLALLDAMEADAMSRRRWIVEAARLYETGTDLDWPRVHRGAPGKRVALPVYPFARRRHWHRTEPVARQHSATKPVAQPSLGTRLSLPFSEEARFEHQWSATFPEYLPHHMLFGMVVFPASAYLSLIVSTSLYLHEKPAVGIQRVRFVRPLAIEKDAIVDAQLIFSSKSDVQSTVKVAGSHDGEWTDYVQAELTTVTGPATHLDMVALAGRCDRLVNGSKFYRDVWANGKNTGASFRWLDRIGVGRGEAYGHIMRPRECLGGSDLHPGLLEALFQLLYCCCSIETRESIEATRSVLVPASIECASWRGDLPSESIGHARLRPQSPDTSSIVGDLVLAAPDGRVVMQIDGFELRPLPQRALNPAAFPAALAVEWVSVSPPDGPVADDGRVVILGESGGFSDGLRTRLAARRRVRLSSDAVGPSTSDLAGQDGDIDGDSRATHWVCLWPLAVAFDPGSSDVEPAVETALAGLFRLLKTRARDGDSNTRVTVVTCHGQAVAGGAPGCCPLQSALWGFVRVAAGELAGVRIRVIDIDKDEASALDQLAADILRPDDEWQIAYRDGARFAARLRTAEETTDVSRGPQCTQYMVTSDESGQGELVARYLRNRGIDAFIGAMEEELPRSDDGRATGLIDTGSRVEDRTLERLEWTQLKSVLVREMQRLLGVHRSTMGRCAGDCIVFSGAAAVLGHPGQSAYATIGAFAHGLVRYRRQQGLPGRQICWGPWSSLGKWSRLSDRQRSRLIENGVKPLSNNQALSAFDAFRHGSRDHVCIAGMDWTRFRPDSRLAAFFSELAQIGEPARSERSLNPPGAGDIVDGLSRILSEQLGIDQGGMTRDTSLSEFGVDSLDAINLVDAIKAAFGVDLSLGEVVDSTSLGELAKTVAASKTDARREPEDFPAVTRVEAGHAESALFPLRPGGGSPPLFFVPADSSTFLSLKPLSDRLATDRPVYAFQAPGIDTEVQPLDSISALARRYVGEMTGVQPHGPYTIIGRCTGGLVAYEMAVALQSTGRKVDRILLLDTLPPTRSMMEPEQNRVERAGPCPGDGHAVLQQRQAQIDRSIRDRINRAPGVMRTRLEAVQGAMDAAVGRYAVGQPFDGILYLIRSAEDTHPVQELWERWASDVEYLGVPGNHETMFETPNLDELGRVITRILEN